MILEDFVMLGTTVPEPNSDQRVFVCSAGVSAELGSLIRIYPLARRNAPHRWGVSRVQLERNPADSRKESFRIAGNRDQNHHQWINYRFEKAAKDVGASARASLLARHTIGSIQEANKKRLSLAILQPDSMVLDFEENVRSAASAPQMTLFDAGENESASGARSFRWMPRIRFRDECGNHNLMLRDWGSFELQRKTDEPYFRNNLSEALHLGPSSSLLVGNMNNQRNTWLVISVLNNIREPETLFDSLLPDPVELGAEARRRIYERDNWQCSRCGSDADRLDVQAVTSQAAKGDGSEYATVCTSCRAPS
ncbi:hypothetical protein OG474_40840 [Kribbella sp. NBC_01505]|uniref:hypothetical protein n=1 Tax=Kribbella sp. NBC_01505 TaxID=2903580 RepID=UPI0038657DAD